MRKIIMTLALLATVGAAMAQSNLPPNPDDSFMPHGGTHGWDSSKGTNNYYESQNATSANSQSDAAYSQTDKKDDSLNSSYTKGFADKKLRKAEMYMSKGKHAKALKAYQDARRAILSRNAKADVSSIDTAIATCKEYLNR